MKRVIRLGDPTTHGGTVVSASPTVTVNGKPVARLGDSVTCPLPGHGVVTIVEGDPNWLVDGRPVALEGHKTSCGASLIPTLGSLIRSPEGAGTGNARLSAAKAVAAAAAMTAIAAATQSAAETVAASQDDEELEYYFVVESVDGSAPELAYRIDRADEKLYEGVLGANGRTVVLPMSQEGEAVFWIPQA